MSAEVIRLPIAPAVATCEDCAHFRGSPQESRCVLYEVQIFSEAEAARDCEGYESCS